LSLGWFMVASVLLEAAGGRRGGGRGGGGWVDQPPDLGGQVGELILEAARRVGAAEPADFDDRRPPPPTPPPPPPPTPPPPPRAAGRGAHEPPAAPDHEGQEQAAENRDSGHQGGELPGIIRDREADPLPVPEVGERPQAAGQLDRLAGGQRARRDRQLVQPR